MNLKTFNSKGYSKIEEGNLQAGDVVIVKNRLGGVHIYEIDAVTKTMAKCRCENYIQRFRISIKRIHTLPDEDVWDTKEYIVYRKN